MRTKSFSLFVGIGHWQAIKRRAHGLVAVSTAVAGLWGASELQAATFSWDSDATWSNGATEGSGNWNTTTANWYGASSNGAWMNAKSGTAQFGTGSGGSAAYTVTLGAPVTVGGIIFQNNAYTISGGELTLAGAAPTITVHAANGSIGSVLDGSTGLTKAGNGTLTLSGKNIYSGGTILAGGTLSVAADNCLGDADGAITVTADSTLSQSVAFNAARNLVINRGASLTVATDCNISWTGAISGDGTFSTGNTMLALSNADNAFTGKLVFSGGLGFASLGDSATNAIQYRGHGGATITLSYIGESDFTLNRPIELYDGICYVTCTAGALILNGPVSTSSSAEKGISLRGAATSGMNQINGVISDGCAGGTMGVNVGDYYLAATWRLTGANTYTKATSVGQGTLEFTTIQNVSGGASSLGAPNVDTDGTIALGYHGNAILKYVGTAPAGHSSDRVINLASAGLNGNVTLDASGAGQISYTSDLTATGKISRTFILQGSSTGSLAGAIVDAPEGSTLLTASFAAGQRTLSLGSVDGIVVGNSISGTGIAGGTTVSSIDAGNKTVTLSAVTTGASDPGGTPTITVDTVKNTTSLAKCGSGTWTLSGSSTYTGNTTVAGGSLKVKGNLSSTGNVTITGSLIIENASAITSNRTTVTLGGTLGVAPGVRRASQTFGALALSGNSTLDFAGTGSTIKFASFIPGTSTLNITRWTYSADHLIFAVSQAANLGKINFNGFSAKEIAVSGGFEAIADRSRAFSSSAALPARPHQ